MEALSWGCLAVQHSNTEYRCAHHFHVVCQCAKSKVIVSNTGAPFNIRSKEHTIRRIPNHAILGSKGFVGLSRRASRAGQRTQAGREEAIKPLNMQA